MARNSMLHDAKKTVDRLRPRLAVAAAHAPALLRARRPAPVAEVLGPAEALRDNGFTVFRGLFGPAECIALSAQMKTEVGINAGERFTNVDATNRFAAPRRVLFDQRVLDSVRAAVGASPRYLQVSDLHYLHDTAAWHRDSVHRAVDSSGAADWADGTYGVVKAILYLESENAAMGIMAGSHRSPREIDILLVKAVEKLSGQIVIGPADEPNRRLTAAERRVPLAWQASAGDLLVFDERLYHAGRRVDDGKVTKHRDAAKFTLSMVFGPDNHHSHRLHSYFRYARRELHYRDFVPELQAQLAEHDLLLRDGYANYYVDHPQELRLAHLRKAEQMDDLVAEFAREAERLKQK